METTTIRRNLERFIAPNVKSENDYNAWATGVEIVNNNKWDVLVYNTVYLHGCSPDEPDN